jgi:hypothetical protein
MAPTDKFNALAEAWRELNRPFEVNDHLGPSRGSRWSIKDKKAPLLLTSVHGVRHFREGVGMKANDANTGGLVLVLAHHLKCSAAVITRSGGNDDANTDPEHPFKAAVANDIRLDRVRLLVDVHGMADHPSADVAIGFGAAPGAATTAAAERIERRLAAAGLRVDLGGVDTGLKAAHPGTMTNWAHARGLAALQLEISRSRRTFQSSTAARAQFLRALAEALEDAQTAV